MRSRSRECAGSTMELTSDVTIEGLVHSDTNDDRLIVSRLVLRSIG